MSILSKIGEMFGLEEPGLYSSRLFDSLQNLEISARVCERGRPEEKITAFSGGSLGIIEIAEGPIRWVGSKKGLVAGAGTYVPGCTEYIVPDARVDSTFQKVKVHKVRVRSFPVLGKVIALQWASNDFGLELMDGMYDENALGQLLSDSSDFEISSYPGHGCWILTSRSLVPPSMELWNCYVSIAHHLLATTTGPLMAHQRKT